MSERLAAFDDERWRGGPSPAPGTETYPEESAQHKYGEKDSGFSELPVADRTKPATRPQAPAQALDSCAAFGAEVRRIHLAGISFQGEECAVGASPQERYQGRRRTLGEDTCGSGQLDQNMPDYMSKTPDMHSSQIVSCAAHVARARRR